MFVVVMLNRRLAVCVTDIVCVCRVGCSSLAVRFLLRVNLSVAHILSSI